MSTTEAAPGVEAAVREIVEMVNACFSGPSSYPPLRENEIAEITAIISKHCTTDAGEVERLRAERLEVQRALASTVKEDPTEDDNPPYTTSEIVNGIRSLEQRRRAAVKRAADARLELSAAHGRVQWLEQQARNLQEEVRKEAASVLTARANAIRECVAAILSKRNEEWSKKGVATEPHYLVFVHYGDAALMLVQALESLAKKEGDDGPTAACD
jgi:hypothetical protein